MNVAVVNPFDPLPGEAIRPGRYAGLCRALAARGHEVRWYSSGFSHAFKKPRDGAAMASAARREGFQVVLVPTGAYESNVSLARLRNHAQLARAMRRIWRAESWRPKVVVTSLPPPGLAAEAADWAGRAGAALVADVQDLWPETFGRFWPAGLGWLNSVVFAGVAANARRVYRQAAAVTGVARGYVDHAKPHLAPGVPTRVLPLGVDLTAFDAAVNSAERRALNKPADVRWLFLGGALSSYVNLPGAVEMMVELRRRGRSDIRLIVAGSGPGESVLRRGIEAHRLDNIDLLGQVSFERFAALASESDLALCPFWPESMVFLPNRVFDYFAAALPVLNTLPGELAALLAERQAGVTVDVHNPAQWANAVEAMLKSPAPPSPRRRGQWVAQYDRSAISEELASAVELAEPR